MLDRKDELTDGVSDRRGRGPGRYKTSIYIQNVLVMKCVVTLSKTSINKLVHHLLSPANSLFMHKVVAGYPGLDTTLGAELDGHPSGHTVSMILACMLHLNV